MKSREDLIRALLHDDFSSHKIWTDERLVPFIQQADAMANIYAAYLIAVSVGALEAADRLQELLPHRRNSMDMLKKGNTNVPETTHP